MRHQLSQIVLDFDGVIADGTNRAYIDTYKEAVRSVGCQRPDSEIEACIARHWGESPKRELAGVLGWDHPQLDPALEYYLQHIDAALCTSACPIPHALNTLKVLAESYSLYLISGMGALPLQHIVEDFGIRHYFGAVISTSDSDLLEQQKASGYHLRELSKRKGWAAQETLCVGDAKSDVAMARQCNIPVVVVLSGALDQERAQALGVTWILPSLASLPNFLRNQYCLMR
jgi:phosphoglycolate phosphatase-like HAD superfamily hydrolase